MRWTFARISLSTSGATDPNPPPFQERSPVPTFNITQRVPTMHPVNIDDGFVGNAVVSGIDCSILPIEVNDDLTIQLISVVGAGLRKGHSYCSLPVDGDFSLVRGIEKFLSTNGMEPFTAADWQVLAGALLALVLTFRPDEAEVIDIDSVDALWDALDCF